MDDEEILEDGKEEKEESTVLEGSWCSTSATWGSCLASANTITLEEGPREDVGKAQTCPEGGTRGWLTVAGSSAAMFVAFGWVTASVCSKPSTSSISSGTTRARKSRGLRRWSVSHNKHGKAENLTWHQSFKLCLFL